MSELSDQGRVGATDMARVQGPAMDSLLQHKQLLVCVGPGGVGKTTVSAALALRAARMGRRVLVLTIDPARRLADALGLDMADDAIHPVDTSALSDQGIEVAGHLDAIMFDNARSMDSLMARLAPTERVRNQILNNRVYRAMAGSLARSHAYLAMERLHEVMTSGDYDLVVLDTPPARNALDILDAPASLSSFLDEGVMKWFTQEPTTGGIRARLMAAGGATAKKLFGMVAGQTFLEEVVGFFEAFKGLREGFQRRAMETKAMLESSDAGFVLVSSAESSHLEDARSLGQSVRERGLPLHGVVFNRSYTPLSGDPMQVITDAGPQPQGEEASGAPVRLLEGLAEIRSQAAEANRRALDGLRGLAAELSGDCTRVMIARLEDDVRDLMGLHRLADYFAKSATPHSV